MAAAGMNKLSSLFKQHIRGRPQQGLHDFVPDDFLDVTLKAIEKLHVENAPNLLYLLARALGSNNDDDNENSLPIESISFKLIHLMLLSVIEHRMEVLELCSMEFMEELDIIDWNKKSFLAGLNEILFPTHSVCYKMALAKSESTQTFVLQQQIHEEDDENIEEIEEIEEDADAMDSSILEEEMDIKNDAALQLQESNVIIEPYFEEEEGEGEENDNENEYSEVDTIRKTVTVTKQETLLDAKDIVTYYKCLECSFMTKVPEEISEHVKEAHSESKKRTRSDSATENINIEQENADSMNSEAAETDAHAEVLTVKQIKTESDDATKKPTKRPYTRSAPMPGKKCHMCTRNFPTEEERTEHVAKADCLTCSECDATYKTTQEWLAHHRTVHGIKVGKLDALCPFCKKKYKKCQLNRHIECVHYKIRKHRCGVCDRGFFERKDRVKHETLCKLDTQVCEICSEEVPSSFQLREHFKSAHQRTMCKHCNEHYDDLGKMKKHLQENHWKQTCDEKKEVETTMCEHCGQVFQGMTLLKRHVKLHRLTDNPAMSYCEECKKSFRSPYYLKRHCDIVHKKIKRFFCDVCGKKFASGAHLQEHIGIHDNIQRYKCDVCGEGFVHRASYKRHAVKHLGSQLFPCSICHRKFDNPCYLKNHVRRVHRGSTIEIRNFQYPGTSLPKHMRKRGQGGRPSNAMLQSDFNADSSQIEIAMTTNADTLEPNNNYELEVTNSAEEILEQIDTMEEGMEQELGLAESVTLSEAVAAQGVKQEDLDLTGMQFLQVEGDDGTKIYCVPEGAQFIEIDNSTINLDNTQFPDFQ